MDPNIGIILGESTSELSKRTSVFVNHSTTQLISTLFPIARNNEWDSSSATHPSRRAGHVQPGESDI